MDVPPPPPPPPPVIVPIGTELDGPGNFAVAFHPHLLHDGRQVAVYPPSGDSYRYVILEEYREGAYDLRFRRRRLHAGIQGAVAYPVLPRPRAAARGRALRHREGRTPVFSRRGATVTEIRIRRGRHRSNVAPGVRQEVGYETREFRFHGRPAIVVVSTTTTGGGGVLIIAITALVAVVVAVFVVVVRVLPPPADVVVELRGRRRRGHGVLLHELQRHFPHRLRRRRPVRDGVRRGVGQRRDRREPVSSRRRRRRR